MQKRYIRYMAYAFLSLFLSFLTNSFPEKIVTKSCFLKQKEAIFCIYQTYVLSRRKALEDMIRLLLRRGANPNASMVPFPVLFFALKTADPDGVANLLSKGASTETRLPKEKGGLAPLHIATTLPGEAGVQITKLLLEAGANPNIQAYPYDSEKDISVIRSFF